MGRDPAGRADATRGAGEGPSSLFRLRFGPKTSCFSRFSWLTVLFDEALSLVFRAEVRTLGASRTDAGVHAKGLSVLFWLREA